MSDEIIVTIEDAIEEISVTVNETDVTRESLGLAITDSPEFADTKITTLNSNANGGIIPNVQFTWLGATAKSVLSFLTKLVDKVYDLATRVGILEDKYLLKYVVPADVASINLTTDRYGNAFNFVEGDEVEILIQVKAWPASLGNRINIRFNDLTSIYFAQTTNYLNFIHTMASIGYSQYSSTFIKIINNEIQGFTCYEYKQTLTPTYNSNQFSISSIDANLSLITSINLYCSNSNPLIPSGSIIIIKKH